MLASIFNHFVSFVSMHPANAGVAILVALLVIWFVGLVRIS